MVRRRIMSNAALSIAPRRPWYTAVVAGMASYLDAAAIAGSATALVLYQQAFGFSNTQFAQLSALLTATIAVGALVGGWLGDRYGRRRVFTATMVLFLLGAGLLTLAPSAGLLYLGIALLGFAGGADLPVALAMVAESAPPEKRGRLVSFSHVLWMLGIVVTIVLGIVGGPLGVTGARLIYGHLFVIALVVLVLRWGIPESAAWKAEHDEALIDAASDRVSLRGARELFTRYLTPLVALTCFYAVVNIAANTNGQFSTFLYVNAAGASVQTANMAGLAGLLAVFVGMAVLMRLVDGARRMVIFIIGGVLASAAFMIPVLAGASVPTLLVAGVLYGLGGAIAGEPMFKVWAQELFPTRLRSSAQGLMIAATRGVAAVFALFTPALLAQGAGVLFGVLVATNVVGVLIGILWVARQRHVIDDAHNDPAISAVQPADTAA
ncbi:MFS transporter [Quadrisphaera sp. KR29]|uniref:MFS transporter n=1 Tax=Quadrisphaera sp. KR29 TaxID=3461391 RepID=UPI004044CD51